MRSLTLKFTLAFLVVGLIGALLVVFFVGQRTFSAYDQFVSDRRQTALIEELAQYYRTHGNWQGVSHVAEHGRPRPGGPPRRQPIVLADADGIVVLGGGRYAPNTQLPLSERARSQPIEVDGAVVGWMLDLFGPERPGRGTPEGDFLARITDALTYGAVGATALALVIGIVLARTLTHPIRELTAATQAIARGALGRQVTVRSQDELGVLAASFNQMSNDLAHASTLRRQMTADIAHDLRTPLSVMLGYTEALRDGKLPGTPDIYETMHIEAQHLQRLIDDLRTLSLADAGELQLARQSIPPQALLERAAAAHRAQAHEDQITLDVQADPELAPVNVDPERMAQVLGNLLRNALRYTSANGTITLAATALDGTVQLHVQDTGTGIASEDVPHIFERFYRADSARQHHDGSSGLGLAIAKSIVEAHGGRIDVHSTKGKGTTFTISLPASRATPLLP